MLYFVFGKDTFRGKQKIKELLDFFRAKIGNNGIFRIDGDNFNLAELEELLKSRTLFEKKIVVVCDGVFEDSRAQKFIEDNIEKFASSQNVYIFFEEDPDKETIFLFKKYAEKIQEFNLLKKPFEEKYNPFPLCDAFASKKKRLSWALYQQALLEGVPAEEVFWKVWWQVKNLLLIQGLPLDLAKETGLHPFVVKKTLMAVKNFERKELKEISFSLLELYHNVRRGLADFEIGLEKILIKV